VGGLESFVRSLQRLLYHYLKARTSSLLLWYSRTNNHDQEKYDPKNYSEDIVLQVALKDAIIIEFEDTPEHNKRYIAKTEETCGVIGLQYCITSHNGRSEYLWIYNIKGMRLITITKWQRILSSMV